MNKTKEYSIFPGQIKINDCTYFGLDYYLTDFVNNLAEENKKYKEVIDKATKYINDEIKREVFHYYLDDEDIQELLDILKEVE